MQCSPGERITWIAPDGSVLYDNMADADTMENHLQRPEVQEAFETGSGALTAIPLQFWKRTITTHCC